MSDHLPRDRRRLLDGRDLGRREVIGYSAAVGVIGALGASQASPASAAVNLAETTGGIETVADALAAAEANAWGGYANGQIPQSALSPVTASVSGSGYLRPDAAQQYLAMSFAFTSAVGRALTITEGYRDYGRQVDYWNRYQAGTGNLAAYPGTSNHGWGVSCDFGAGVETAGSTAKRWLDANAGSFGWEPTGNTFSRVEPWHFDYTRAYAPVTTNVKPEDVDVLIVRCNQRLNEVGIGFTALVGVKSLRHMSTMDMVYAMRLVGTPYYDVTATQFYDILSSLSIPRSALKGDADFGPSS